MKKKLLNYILNINLNQAAWNDKVTACDVITFNTTRGLQCRWKCRRTLDSAHALLPMFCFVSLFKILYFIHLINDESGHGKPSQSEPEEEKRRQWVSTDWLRFTALEMTIIINMLVVLFVLFITSISIKLMLSLKLYLRVFMCVKAGNVTK